MNHAIAGTRRSFLKSAGVAGVFVSVGRIPCPPLYAAEASAVSSPGPRWVDKPMRWAQLTLVEDDPGKFDPQFWLDYFERIRSDAVCLSAGGCVAYYPTKVRFHHRSAWLGERDVFGDLVAGCRKLGMVVIARTDPHATYDDAREAQPLQSHDDEGAGSRADSHRGAEGSAASARRNAGETGAAPRGRQDSARGAVRPIPGRYGALGSRP